MPRNDDSKSLLPAEQIDGLKVKETVNANLKSVDLPATSSPSTTAPGEVKVAIPTKQPSNKKPVNRCFECRKKLPLSALKCRCEHTFCAEHRMAEDHCCPYDFKSLHKKQLENNLNKVVSLKVNQI
ncbi:zinc finger A20 and AN1 domain-containing stress-associated protein [Acrasis kona]|uniref:Zinc finger A20 and AN1 domain-containing stress-associated protein n=1 Tax=Acrasis kona TaxID=1008807 RepID=A0AAW2YPJ5_9EUKA